MRSHLSRHLSTIALVYAASLAACGGKKDSTPATTAPVASADAAPTKPAPVDHDHDHGDHDHAHKAPHGGIVQSAGKYHLELVAGADSLQVYLSDADEKELPLDGVSGKATVALDGKDPVDAPLAAMGSHLHAQVTLAGNWIAVVTLSVAGEAVSARFEGKSAAPAEHAAMYTCPMHPQVMQDKPGKCPICGVELVPAKGSDMHMDDHHDHDHDADSAHAGGLSDKVELHAKTEGEVTPGKPVHLELALHATAGDAPVGDLEVVHEKPFHLFVVSADLANYQHVHPTPETDGKDGEWHVEVTFPTPGEYRVYADVKSTALGAMVAMAKLTVPGTAPAPKPLAADSAQPKTVDGLAITLTTTPAALVAGEATLTYHVVDAASGKPVADLEPYLGALGHLFVLHQDLVTPAHAHPQGPDLTAQTRGGPDVSFHTSFAKPGFYKLWAQFQHAGKVTTADFVVEVK